LAADLHLQVSQSKTLIEVTAMTKIRLALSMILPLTALTVALCVASQPMFAQGTSGSWRKPIVQQQPMPPGDQNSASVNTFSGKIVKSGDKFVLAASDNLTTYQLDDQQKAQDFLNKSVKVTGSLDASTGTIRVRAIDPI
jgi:hypothetical protein